MNLMLVVKLLDEQPCSSPFIQGAPGLAFPLAHLPRFPGEDAGVCALHHHPLEVGEVKLC